MTVLAGSLGCFAVGWGVATYCLVLRRAPYGRFPHRPFVTLLEFSHQATLVTAIVMVLILQLAMLVLLPPVVAAASLATAGAGAFAVCRLRRFIAGP